MARTLGGTTTAKPSAPQPAAKPKPAPRPASGGGGGSTRPSGGGGSSYGGGGGSSRSASPASYSGGGSAQGAGGLNPGFSASLQALIAASGGRIYITSGYRSPQRQAELFSAAVRKYGSEAAARKWVAPPGRSNHGRGIAADLGFADAGARNWAHANAGRFGLRFPMSWEPWHIEPIGGRASSSRDAYTTPPDGYLNPRDAIDGGLDDMGNVEDPFDPGTQARRLFEIISGGGSTDVGNSPESVGASPAGQSGPGFTEAVATVATGMDQERL
jgi:hypothetical protein